MHAFTFVFLAALALTTATRIWLARRHMAYVQAHRSAVPEKFSARVSLAAHQRAADYTCEKVKLGIWHTLFEVAILLMFTLGGVLQALDAYWSGPLGEGLARGVALIASVVVIGGVLDLPFSIYRTFVIETKFGFNKMTLRLFVADLVKQALLAAVLGLPLAVGALWMMRVLGSWWWLYAWLAWIVVNVVLIAVYPTWIAPLFNKFTPLNNPELKARIETLLQKCGFKAQGLFVMDGSRRSSHGNAYFTGFGKSKRIVFFDTLLKSLNSAEVEAVLAHELGHFKLRHVVKRILLTFGLSFVFLWLLGYLAREPWFFQGLHINTPSAGAALVLFFLVLPVFTFFFQPIASFYSRRQEFEADEYAAQVAHAPHLVDALVKLYEDNASTLTPDPLHSAFYDSHPPAAMRITRLQQAAAA